MGFWKKIGKFALDTGKDIAKNIKEYPENVEILKSKYSSYSNDELKK